MTWFKVDDGFWSNPKALDLTDSATALWVRAGSYACQHLTDGHIKTSTLRILGTIESADELVDAGLWKTTKNGYRFHDWAEYQETSTDVKERREQAKERQRRRRASRGSHKDVTRDNTVTDTVTHDERHAPVTREFATPDPTRPDPTRPDHLTTSGGDTPTPPTATTKRATELPADWTPSDNVRTSVKAAFPNIDIAYETEKFRDYWLSVGGARGRKKDWDRTWRSWIRKANEDLGARSNRGRQQPQRRTETIADWGASPQAADYFGLPWGDTEPPFPDPTIIDAEVLDHPEIAS